MEEEELYDDAQAADETEAKGSTLRQINTPSTPKYDGSATSKRGSGPPPASIGPSLKERLAQLQENLPKGPIPIKPPVKPKPNVGPRPGISSTSTPPPKLGPSSSPSRGPGLNMSQINRGRQTLKNVTNKRDSQRADTDFGKPASKSSVEKVNSFSDDIFSNADGKKFKRLSFKPQIRKPPKIQKSLTEFATPIIRYLDVDADVERRIGVTTRDDSIIRSMTEDEELEEQSSASSLPPALPTAAHRSGPPPLPVTSHQSAEPVPPLPSRSRHAEPVDDPSVEELYDVGEAAADADSNDQELYDDVIDVSPVLPQPPDPVEGKGASPEASTRQTRAEKEREKKEKKEKERLEKKEKERLEKQRQKEKKEQDAFCKKYEITADEHITDHPVKCVKSFTGKTTISLNENEQVFLVRKLSDTKWIVKHPDTALVGLVDASCMNDPDESRPAVANGMAIANGDDEEIYEEVNDP